MIPPTARYIADCLGLGTIDKRVPRIPKNFGDHMQGSKHDILAYVHSVPLTGEVPMKMPGERNASKAFLHFVIASWGLIVIYVYNS